MRIIIISDTHGIHNYMKYKLPKGDVLIHCGDLTNTGTEENIRDFVYWFQNIKGYEDKIFIAGNHDWGFERKHPWLSTYINEENLSQSDCTYLEDTFITIETPEFDRPIKIYGTPWQPRFYDWAFNVDRNKLHLHWEKIPTDTDILITHGPPHGIRDLTIRNDRTGCTSLRQTVLERVNPVIHCFGHIHEDYGTLNINGTLYINASICTRQYQPINPPVIVKLTQKQGIFETKILKR